VQLRQTQIGWWGSTASKGEPVGAAACLNAACLWTKQARRQSEETWHRQDGGSSSRGRAHGKRGVHQLGGGMALRLDGFVGLEMPLVTSAPVGRAVWRQGCGSRRNGRCISQEA
jgi:hypothetical protein